MFSRRLLLFVFVLLTLHQLGAVVTVLRLPDDVAASLSLPAWAQVVAGSVWTLVFGWTTVLLFRRMMRPMRALWLLAVFILYSLLRLLLFAWADYDRQRLSFLFVVVMVGMTLIRTIVVAWKRLTKNGENL